MSDALSELIARAQRGDMAAFGRLVAETQGGVYNVAYNILRDHEEAQDMTQEVYLRAWRALPAFRGEAKFSTWLYRVAVNTCLNRRRQLRSRLSIVDSEEVWENLPAAASDPAEKVLTRVQSEHLWAVVDRLPEKYRLVIALFYQQQLSYPEIAALLALPLGTIKAHLNRARELLARRLRAEREDERVVVSSVS